MTKMRFPLLWLAVFSFPLSANDGASGIPSGVYRPINTDANVSVSKLTVNSDGSGDLEVSERRVVNSMRLGKLESNTIIEKVQITGRFVMFNTDALSKTSDALDSKEFGKLLKEKCSAMKDLGYEQGGLLELLKASAGKKHFLFFYKDGSLIEALSGEKLKKAWW